MGNGYLLDTNTYYLLFQRTESTAYANLEPLLRHDGIVSFYISEITGIEIHSVIGKARRGIQFQQQVCTRKLLSDGQETTCSKTWVTQRQKGINTKIYRAFQKMALDIENHNGIIQATVLPVNLVTLNRARDFLRRYADRFNFGSHDAVIAGTVLSQKELNGLDLSIVTSDKGFKAALSIAGMDVFDPNER